MLNGMKVTKRLEDGNYKGILTSYAEREEQLIVNYSINGAAVSNSIGFAVPTAEGPWNKVQNYIDTLGGYHYEEDAIQLLEYIIANKVELNLAVKSGRFAHLLPLDAPAQKTETTAAPVRKARA